MPDFHPQDAPVRNRPGKVITEGEARRFFQRCRWRNLRKACPRCGSREVKEVRRNRLLCPVCHYEFGDFTGTYLARVHVGFKVWLGLLQLFELEWSPRQAAEELGLSYSTVSWGFQIIRMAIATQGHNLLPRREEGAEEAVWGGDASGGDQRDQQVLGLVFGIREGSDRVRVEEVPGLTAEDLAGLQMRPTGRSPVVYTSKFHTYDSLMFCLAGKTRGDSFSASLMRKRGVSSLPGFRGYARERFVKHHGISREKFPLYLKELEFRYNHREIVSSFTILAGYLTQPWQNLYNEPNNLIPSLKNLDKDKRYLLFNT
jgi:transposase